MKQIAQIWKLKFLKRKELKFLGKWIGIKVL